MLDPNAINKIEKAISLINKDNWAPVTILKQLLKDTEDDINNIASIEQRANKTEHIQDVIPRVLAKLKKEMDYGTPEETVLSTKSLQRNKDRTSKNRREWDTNK